MTSFDLTGVLTVFDRMGNLVRVMHPIEDLIVFAWDDSEYPDPAEEAGWREIYVAAEAKVDFWTKQSERVCGPSPIGSHSHVYHLGQERCQCGKVGGGAGS